MSARGTHPNSATHVPLRAALRPKIARSKLVTDTIRDTVVARPNTAVQSILCSHLRMSNLSSPL